MIPDGRASSEYLSRNFAHVEYLYQKGPTRHWRVAYLITENQTCHLTTKGDENGGEKYVAEACAGPACIRCVCHWIQGRGEGQDVRAHETDSDQICHVILRPSVPRLLVSEAAQSSGAAASAGPPPPGQASWRHLRKESDQTYVSVTKNEIYIISGYVDMIL